MNYTKSTDLKSPSTAKKSSRTSPVRKLKKRYKRIGCVMKYKDNREELTRLLTDTPNLFMNMSPKLQNDCNRFCFHSGVLEFFADLLAFNSRLIFTSKSELERWVACSVDPTMSMFTFSQCCTVDKK